MNRDLGHHIGITTTACKYVLDFDPKAAFAKTY